MKKFDDKDDNDIELSKEQMLNIFKDISMEIFQKKLGTDLMQKHNVNRDNVGIDKWLDVAKKEIKK